ncbi:hypothetical protein F528_1403 [Neisseria meningitidis 992008]|uniref:Uncharacterized protein n=3 Tax=Neisseria meningitidis TaxID=487 RepID=E0N8X2_NEIM3|nr:hypothetical protein HMPREF0602_0952 [Neisseria meningitidis ATCC 13091]KER39620.1 hypothetical protein F528_1403 [Neisseria meningitidis 992008]CBA07548.1 hypothetical protein predicted by Glimmer/Critica [Neisseria meningitidis alpha275]CBA09533.1 hypothetical protein predicted by Glimmer/Critica [Neisseria meningitidis alpha153]
MRASLNPKYRSEVKNNFLRCCLPRCLISFNCLCRLKAPQTA